MVKVDAELAAEKPEVDTRAKVVADAELVAEESTAAERLKATELAAARAEHEQQFLAHGAAMEAEDVFERETCESIAARDATKHKLDLIIVLPRLWMPTRISSQLPELAVHRCCLCITLITMLGPTIVSKMKVDTRPVS